MISPYKSFTFVFYLMYCFLALKSYGQSKTDKITSNEANKIGIEHLKRQAYPLADSAFLECISLSGAERNFKNEGKCKSNLASSYFSQQRLSEALPLYLEVINVCREHHLDTLFGETLLNLGWTYLNMDIYDSAMVNLHKGISMLEKFEPKSPLMKGYNFLGSTLRKSGSQSPQYYFNKSLSLAQEFNDTVHIAVVYNNLGNYFRDEGVLDSAIYYFKKSLKLKTAPSRLATSHFNLAQAYTDKEMYAEAEKEFLTSYQIREKLGLHSKLFKNYLELVNLYQLTHEDDKAQLYISRADSVAQMASLVPSVKIEYLQLKRGQFYKEKAYDKALDVSDQILTLKDALYEEERQNLATRYEALFSVSRWKNAFEVEAINRQQEALAYEQDKITTRWIGLVFLMLLIGALLFAKLRSTKAKVATAQAELHAQKAETERIRYQELNHRTNNLLTIFSSLITIQENDPVNKENSALPKIRSQADAITSVYQLLGQSTKAGEKWIDMSEYIDALVHNLCTISMFDDSQYTITKELEAIKIPEYQCNSFALIVNEVITNAIKYGKDQNGRLTLDLQLRELDNEIIFILKDGGQGFSDQPIRNGEGNILLNLLSKQLKAQIKYGVDGSSDFEMRFPQDR